MSDQCAGSATFSVILRPNRSLSPRGFMVVMAILIGVSFIAGLAFLMMGAWPVVGFFGLDVALVWWAFRASYAGADVRETVDVTDHELILRRMEPGRPVREHRFTRGWVTVELTEDAHTELVGPLRLRSRGRATELGAFLAPWERRSLASELRAALARKHV